MAKRHQILGFFSGLWRVIDWIARLAVNLIVIFVVLLVLSVVFSSGAPKVPSSAALVIAPAGNLVDQLAGDPFDRALEELFGDAEAQTRVKDLVDAIEAAQDDDRIQALVLNLDNMLGAGLSKLQTVGAAIETFKQSGKTVIAVGNAYLQNQYYLASYADEIYMHPMGVVALGGYGRFRLFYKGAIDKLEIDWNVFKVGEYKSYVEPYTRTDMSAEDRESSLVWLNGLWNAYQADVVTQRDLAPDAITRYVENLLPDLRRSEGDFARLAIQHELVDELLDHPAIRQRLIDLVGEDEDTLSFKQINHQSYLQAIRLSQTLHGRSTNKIGVIVASGEILPGDQPPGTIGAQSLARLIRKVRVDEDVKAVVLHVDSGGGSVFASDVIFNELQSFKDSGRPVIASMSSTAASGGYYIALPADEIWAHPTTVTGSIGIFAMFPTFQRTLDKIGLSVDGVGTTSWSGDFRPDRELSDDARQLIQLNIENGYAGFISKVAERRGLSLEKVDEIARGRVWVGEAAKNLGLVDQLGGLSSAIEAAAERAGVAEDYQVKVYEKTLSFRQQMFLDLVGLARGLADVAQYTSRSTLSEIHRWVEDKLDFLARFEDPRHLYYYCFCEVD